MFRRFWNWLTSKWRKDDSPKGNKASPLLRPISDMVGEDANGNEIWVENFLDALISYGYGTHVRIDKAVHDYFVGFNHAEMKQTLREIIDFLNDSSEDEIRRRLVRFHCRYNLGKPSYLLRYAACFITGALKLGDPSPDFQKAQTQANHAFSQMEAFLTHLKSVQQRFVDADESLRQRLGEIGDRSCGAYDEISSIRTLTLLGPHIDTELVGALLNRHIAYMQELVQDLNVTARSS